jgi:hypothetical protein
MTIDPDPERDAVLERRGVKVIQALLATAAGSGEESTVEGLAGRDGQVDEPQIRRGVAPS